MLLTIALILFIIWLVLQLAHVALGGLLWILLIIAIAVAIYDLLVGRRRL